MSISGQILKTFQGGAIRRITIAATAGNVATNLTPAGGAFKNKRWRVLRGYLLLTCDATVANRNFGINITDGTHNLQALGISAVIVATQTGYVSFGEPVTANLNWTVTPDGGSVRCSFNITNCYLEGADAINIYVNGGVAGDSYAGYVEVLETVI
jgi:hypothetical protein